MMPRSIRPSDTGAESISSSPIARTVRVLGVELRVSATTDDGVMIRGIIDRLELDDDGELVVTDYKTGRAPHPNYERKSLSGVQFYAFLCESVFGRIPAAVRLVYLKSG